MVEKGSRDRAEEGLIGLTLLWGPGEGEGLMGREGNLESRDTAPRSLAHAGAAFVSREQS